MKRTAIKRRPLADTVLASLEPEDKEYRESYGRDRLYFVVSPSGRKRWEMRYKKPDSGRWGWLGLGSYPDVTAKLARQRADEAFALVQQGIDPVKQRKEQQRLEQEAEDNLFRVTAEEWYARKQQMGRAPKTLHGIRIWLDNDALPALGHLPIDRITRAQCRELQKRIEERAAFNTAEKARTWLNQIVGNAIAHGRTENNPAARADHRLLRARRVPGGHAAVDRLVGCRAHPANRHDRLPLEQFREAMAKVKGREAIGRVLLASLWSRALEVEVRPAAGAARDGRTSGSAPSGRKPA